MTANEITSGRPITGRMVLTWLLMFFGVIIAVNGAFVYFALNSWPGLSTEQAYEDGLAYNKTLDAAKLQQDLGWKTLLELGANEQLTVRIFDKSGALVTDLSPTAQVGRAIHENEDRTLSLKETAPGTYTAPVAGLASGRWKVELRVLDGQETRFFIVHELQVK